ncbi:MAG: iron ABC transporter, partial [Verrucomicrobia bacterium]|nr:iron ABC transporter [Verrucomicrobiota bacterium]
IVFLFSMIFGMERGVLRRTLERLRLRRRVQWQHLLRALYEWNEQHTADQLTLSAEGLESAMPLPQLLAERSWKQRRLNAILRYARRKGFIRRSTGGAVQLTEDGFQEARRVVRNHRLWETYLITHADIAPIHVDRNADLIEHVLGQTMVAKLEKLLTERRVPPSPHAIKGSS